MQGAVAVEDLIELVNTANKNQKRRRRQSMIIVFYMSDQVNMHQILKLYLGLELYILRDLY